ncbi:MAG: LacI family DNA-binding transcriptional regulator [Clostridiaceae bacterium]
MNKTNHTTVKDVADRAGVSPSTVSRVISNHPKISEKTKTKVHKIMDELGYYPNAIARSLASKKTGTIGVILPARSGDLLLNPFFPEALRGILKGASLSPYDVLLSSSSEGKSELQMLKTLIRSSKVDGIILMSSKVDDECQEYLNSIEFPFSLIGSPYHHKEKVNHVDNDNYMAAYEMTTYLSMIGKKKIALIAGEITQMVTMKRVEGYKKALMESNLPFNEKLLFTGKFDEETGYLYGNEILNLKEKPDAIIITDDLIAFGAVHILKGNGVKIPEDIAVASFNNSVLSRYSDIPLTSVEINSFDLGYEAALLLVSAINEGIKGKKVIIPYTIIKRQSTEGEF